MGRRPGRPSLKAAMTRDDAMSLAVDLRTKEKTFRDIARTLEKSGYRSEKTGRPLTTNAVALLVKRAPLLQSAAAQAPEASAKLSNGNGRLAVISQILRMKTLPSDERIEMALRLI